ncbi:MAG: hypothetical protein MMC33_002901 [Icmadophila ericetorum]|nr:hypothetical protein [Icmadophila ericetorum]
MSTGEDLTGNTSQQIPKRHHATSVGKRLKGRLSYTSLRSQNSPRIDPLATEPVNFAQPESSVPSSNASSSRLLSQVSQWLEAEKAKRARKKRPKEEDVTGFLGEPALGLSHEDWSTENVLFRRRSSSQLSDGSLALEKLEKIIKEYSITGGDGSRAPIASRRGSRSHLKRSLSVKSLRKGSGVPSSDTEYNDGDALVPSAEVVLDNSKTMSYSGGGREPDGEIAQGSKRAAQEKEAWHVFKNEIVRLTHTLRLKGWRRVPLDRGVDIEVERLSGALTNAVYVVTPPENLQDASVDEPGTMKKRQPRKLLLRIYGPQVEHLIDRENELQILRRLARKKIGPRLLGTFMNGRFEEFFHARTLTAPDLRIPETSKQIAKRMRELHDGIELLEEERSAGPFIWKNWDKWVSRCEEVITWIDQKMLSEQRKAGLQTGAQKKTGLICGVEWSIFRNMVESYRQWLAAQYGGSERVKQQLVFAHNDTQYGNLLRVEPSGESPLLLPANEHKQLVVIDFEYASANTPGLEFSNHFTEWCYNYHDPCYPWACNTLNYPTTAEQYRFVKAYVQHRPQFHPSASSTPLTRPSIGTSSVSSFMLDSRAPSNQNYSYVEEEKKREAETDLEVKRLLHETRLWRVANSAQWVAWGIVQAKVTGMDDTPKPSPRNPEPTSNPVSPMLTNDDKTPRASKPSSPPKAPSKAVPHSDPLSPEIAALAEAAAHDRRPESASEEDKPGEEEEEFDYLAYAQDRAMFFWGDVLALGLVRREDLPEGLLERVKIVDY